MAPEEAARPGGRELRRCTRYHRGIDPPWLARCHQARRQRGDRHGADRACGKGNRVGGDASIALDVTRLSTPKSALIGPHFSRVSAVLAPVRKALKDCKSMRYSRTPDGQEP